MKAICFFKRNEGSEVSYIGLGDFLGVSPKMLE